VVTLFTIRLSVENLLFAHTEYYVFLCISEQTAIIYVYGINWSVFITETESVYCEVRTESLWTNQVSLIL